MMTRSLVPLFALSLAAVIAGCSSSTDESKADSEDSSAAAIDSALNMENGGLDAKPETPMFGDAMVADLPIFAPKFADATDQVAAFSAQAPGAKRYDVVVMWGHMPAPHDADPTVLEPKPIDWTGSVSVDKGAIGLSHTVKFDDKDAVLPRTDPRSLSFESHTLPHVDGLLLHVIVPADAPQTLHFKTDALTTDIDLASLDKTAGGGQRLDDGRNGMVYLGFQDSPGCAKGFVFGRWGKVKPQLGRLHGSVFGARGERLGHVKGIWGHAKAKDKDVFFGKYIEEGGEFRGLFGGVYGGGKLGGIWGTRDPKDAGTLEGVYSDGYMQKDGKGVWLGRWSERCGG